MIVRRTVFFYCCNFVWFGNSLLEHLSQEADLSIPVGSLREWAAGPFHYGNSSASLVGILVHHSIRREWTFCQCSMH